MRLLGLFLTAALIASQAESATILLDTGNVTSDPGANFNSGSFNGTEFVYDADRIAFWKDTDADITALWGTGSGHYTEQIRGITIKRSNGGKFNVESLFVPWLASRYYGAIELRDSVSDVLVSQVEATLAYRSVSVIAQTILGEVILSLPGFNPGFLASAPPSGFIYNSNPKISLNLKNVISLEILPNYDNFPDGPDFDTLMCADYNIPSYRLNGGAAGTGSSLAESYCNGEALPGQYFLSSINVQGQQDYYTAFGFDGVTVAPVPLPGTLILLTSALGLLGGGLSRRRSESS